jgi:hypothetical protein
MTQSDHLRPLLPNESPRGAVDHPRASLSRRLLLVLLYFGAVSSFSGTVLAVQANGGPIPVRYLVGTPFTSYLVPGLILGIVVGGTQLVAAVVLQKRRKSSLVWTGVAGFGMMVWIFIELAMIKQYSFLQSIYFGLGAAEIILVLALLGIAPAVVPPLVDRRMIRARR